MPSEKGGAGANGYTYFVCSQLGGALSRLPQVKPAHIRAARQIKKFVTGKLDTQVDTHILHTLGMIASARCLCACLRLPSQDVMPQTPVVAQDIPLHQPSCRPLGMYCMCLTNTSSNSTIEVISVCISSSW